MSRSSGKKARRQAARTVRRQTVWRIGAIERKPRQPSPRDRRAKLPCFETKLATRSEKKRKTGRPFYVFRKMRREGRRFEHFAVQRHVAASLILPSAERSAGREHYCSLRPLHTSVTRNNPHLTTDHQPPICCALLPRAAAHTTRFHRSASAVCSRFFHKLYDGLARDVEFICAALAPPKHHECARGWHTSSRNTESSRLTPTTSRDCCCPIRVYLQPSSSSSNEPFVLSVGNVQAGEPYQLQLVHTLQREEHGAQVEAGPLNAVCTALAEAARLVHPTGDTCVAILAKPLELLAMRTRIDVRGVGERLRTRHGVSTVLYLSVDDLADAHLDPYDARAVPWAAPHLYRLHSVRLFASIWPPPRCRRSAVEQRGFCRVSAPRVAGG